MKVLIAVPTSAIAGRRLCSTREPIDCQRAKVPEFMVATLGRERKKSESIGQLVALFRDSSILAPS